ncbi:MAG: hypothetical protein M3083_04025 [Actinomycetota bacterium]|nr:hypothetical protein [Actinomycetota bacterium]MDQ6946251.1 hypothetical protein [Actinomycetota bacterium]
MKKFVPVGVATIGIVGFLGVGASVTSALPTVHTDTVSQQVCAAIKSAETAENNKTNSDLNAQVVDAQDAAAQVNQVAHDSVVFGNAYNAYIISVMNGQPGGIPQSLRNAVTALQNDLVTYQSSQTTLNNINTTVNLDGVIISLLADWRAALTQPPCISAPA